MQEITTLVNLMELVRRTINKDLPIQHLTLLLTVANNPGITMPDLSDKLDMPQGTVSRNVKLLGTYAEEVQVPIPGTKKTERKIEARGYGLVRTEPDLLHRKTLAVYLTKQGEAFVKRMTKMMQPPKAVAA